MPASPVLLPPGEDLAVPERVVVAPSRGVFTPAAEGLAAGGRLVAAGQVIGTIESSGTMIDVASPFHGQLMGMLADKGERVREGEPVAWLRALPA